MSQPLAIALIMFCAVALVFQGAWKWRKEDATKEKMKNRLGGKTDPTQAVANDPNLQSVLREERFSDIEFINKLFERAAFAGMLRLWLLQARIRMSPGAVLMTVALLLVSGAVVSWFVAHSVFTSIAVGLALASIPMFVVERKRRKRFLNFARQLPDALTMMKNSLQAGHTLDKAMNVISEEMADPIALEFRETVEEIHLGVPVKRAMENFSTRIIDENLNMFIAALLVQREVGGNLNTLLGNLANTIRERFRMQQEVKALTAEGRISGYVIGILPLALGVIINSMQPSYLKPLVTTDIGVTLVKVAFTLEVIGFYCIRKVCKVNF